MFNNSSFRGPLVAQWVMSLHLTTHTSLSPIRRGFAPGFVNYKKGCTRLATSCHKVYQLLAHGRWFSSGTPASSSGSTTKTGRHDIAEILLKVALKHKKSINQSSFSLENYANSRGVEHDVPKTVVMYNKLMGGVDMADQLLTTYDPNVKSVKLWKKLLMNVLLRITGKSSEIN